MIDYGTYVKYSLEGMLCTLDEEYQSAKPARRSAIDAEKAAISADYNTFVELAGALPQFPEKLFERIFPRRNRRGEIYIRIKPADAIETISFLDIFESYPLAHQEGGRKVFPHTTEGEIHRIFPYTLLVKIASEVLCRVMWCYQYRKDQFAFIRTHLPDELTKQGVDASTGALKDSMFVAGLAPYVYVRTNVSSRHIGLHFPKAYIPIAPGRFRLLTWRDIPLFDAVVCSKEGTGCNSFGQ